MTVRLNDFGRFDVQDAATGGISRSMAVQMLDEINAAWKRGKPLSNVPQTRREGRFAPLVLSRKFEVPADAVQSLIEQWLMNGICEVNTTSSHTKMKGLKMVQKLD